MPRSRSRTARSSSRPAPTPSTTSSRPSETLADSDTFQAAEDDLGDGLTPSFFVNFAPILDLVDSTGQTDADIESARPYLNALDFLIGGSKVDGDRSVAGFTLGVQDQPADTRLDHLGGDHPLTGVPGVPALGIDLIEIDRVERALERRPRLADRLFRPGELDACRDRARPARHLAARFAAKEAAIKALGGGCGPLDVEVVGDPAPGAASPWPGGRDRGGSGRRASPCR